MSSISVRASLSRLYIETFNTSVASGQVKVSTSVTRHTRRTRPLLINNTTPSREPSPSHVYRTRPKKRPSEKKEDGIHLGLDFILCRDQPNSAFSISPISCACPLHQSPSPPASLAGGAGSAGPERLQVKEGWIQEGTKLR